MNDEIFNKPVVTFRITPDLLTSEKETKILDYFHQLSVLHYRTRIKLVDHLTEKELFASDGASSIEDSLSKLYLIPVELLKTIECGIGVCVGSKVTCTFVIPQLIQDMRMHQIMWQTVRIVAINGKQLDVGYLSDAVKMLLHRVTYQNFSYFINIETKNEIGVYEYGLLYKCCQMVDRYCSNTFDGLWSRASDEVLHSQFRNYHDASTWNVFAEKRPLRDLEEVRTDLKWAKIFANGEYQYLMHKKGGSTSDMKSGDDSRVSDTDFNGLI